MHVSLLLVSTFMLFVTRGSLLDYDEINQRLISLSEQLNRVELQLNQSVIQLLNKMNENNHDMTNLIKSLRTSSADTETSRPVNRPVSALLIIDVQYDFINGSLAVRNCPSKHNGEEIIPVINQLLDTQEFDVVAYSYDWHPIDHISFFDNLHLRSHLLANESISLADLHVYSTATFAIPGLPHMKQTLWPRHCVQNTSGARVHSDLKMIDEANTQNISVVHIYKGMKPDVDSYSAFWDNFKLSETELNHHLKEKNVTQVFVVGLATDWCVYSTALHAMEYGYKTFIIEDACRGVDENSIKDRLDDFKHKNGHVIQSSQVKDYMQ